MWDTNPRQNSAIRKNFVSHSTPLNTEAVKDRIVTVVTWFSLLYKYFIITKTKLHL